MFDYAAYAQKLREEIHMYPEIGFDLPRTLAVVRRELEDMGIPYTEKYGKSSIVATINEEKKHFTIGLRADMDALPIQEATDVPYKSRIDGQMHACGHDAHTAILLAAARKLMSMKDQINCRIKLLFTPAEEYIEPGCKQMVENGVMDDIDCCVGQHTNTDQNVGKISILPGGMGANSMGFTVDFYGKTAHACGQHKGTDAIMIAVQAITALEIMNAKEIAPQKPRLLNIGSIHGGNTNNVICDHVSIFGSCRAWEDSVSQYMERRIQEICQGIAAMNGGRAEYKQVKFLPYRINHPVMAERVRETAKKVVGEENIVTPNRNLGGEDFGFLSREKPCMFFMFGIKPPEAEKIAPGHNDHFDVDPRCYPYAIDMFVQFVLDNMDGIQF